MSSSITACSDTIQRQSILSANEWMNFGLEWVEDHKTSLEVLGITSSSQFVSLIIAHATLAKEDFNNGLYTKEISNAICEVADALGAAQE